MTDVCFPIISADYPDAGGTLTAWLVDDGDTVSAGQDVAEVSVNKAFGSIEAPSSGTIRLVCAADDVVVQGSVIARIEG